MFPYAAAKSGVVGLTRSLALDYVRDNVRVNAVCPGWVRTALVDESLARQPDPDEALAAVVAGLPLGRMADPSEVAALVAFLASRDATYITGSAVTLDGGATARFGG